MLMHEQADYFSTEHLLLLQAIASQAAIAIENGQLLSGMEQEHERLNAIIQNVAESILLFDKDKRLLMINVMGQKLFTNRIEAGQKIVAGMGFDSLLTLLEKSYETNQPQSAEAIRFGDRLLKASVTPIREGDILVTLNNAPEDSKEKEFSTFQG